MVVNILTLIGAQSRGSEFGQNTDLQHWRKSTTKLNIFVRFWGPYPQRILCTKLDIFKSSKSALIALDVRYQFNAGNRTPRRREKIKFFFKEKKVSCPLPTSVRFCSQKDFTLPHNIPFPKFWKCLKDDDKQIDFRVCWKYNI